MTLCHIDPYFVFLSGSGVCCCGVLPVFCGTAAAIVHDGLTDELGRADVAVVLGNTVQPDGSPSARLQARLDRAAALYEQEWCRSILVSGGLGKEGHNEALVMQQYLLAQDIPAQHIFIDPEGVTTYATARHTAHLLQEQSFHSVIAVSQYYHLPRVRLALQRSGVQTVYTAHAYFSEWCDLYSIVREVPAWYSFTRCAHTMPNISLYAVIARFYDACCSRRAGV